MDVETGEWDCHEISLRDLDQAVRLAEKAVQLSPKSGMYWNTLCTARYRAGLWPSAIESLKKSISLRGDNSHDLLFLAMSYWQSDDKEQARRYHDQAVKLMSQDDSNDEELQWFRDETEKLLDVK